MPRSTYAAALTVFTLLTTPVEGADIVVGPPCHEAAFNYAVFNVMATGGGTVTFDCGNGAVIPNTFAKWIWGNVTIDGGGRVTISGGNAASLFYVDSAGRLTLEGITLSDGFKGEYDGGAIHNDGTLIVSNSTFRNNRTSAAGSGGAIVSYGPVQITDSLFEGNQGGTHAGALYLRFAAQASIRNTVFRNNSTVDMTEGLGGAILTWDGATATIEGGEMYGNTASRGGAIYNTAFAAQSSVAITGTSIHHNQVALSGGGIYSRGLLTMTASVVDANSAPAGAGGGLYLAGSTVAPFQAGTTVMAGSTISGNSAGQGGGVFLETHVGRLTGTDVRGNTTSTYGGGLYNHYGQLTMDGGSVQHNSAGWAGGGVYAGSGGAVPTQTELRGVAVSDNTAAIGGAGGGLYLDAGRLMVIRCTVDHNSASQGGGVVAHLGSLEISDSTLNANTATAGVGGGVWVASGSAVFLNSTVSGNTAVDSGGGASVAGLLRLENVTLNGNAAAQGGGLAVGREGAQIMLENTIVANSPQGGNCNGTIASSKYSIADDNTCGLVGPGDRNATDPMLMPLGAYGGPTLVHMLAPGSPAIDGVFGNDAPATDQRGIARPQGLGFDVGAVERTPTDPDEPPDVIFTDGFEGNGLHRLVEP